MSWLGLGHSDDERLDLDRDLLGLDLDPELERLQRLFGPEITTVKDPRPKIPPKARRITWRGFLGQWKQIGKFYADSERRRIEDSVSVEPVAPPAPAACFKAHINMERVGPMRLVWPDRQEYTLVAWGLARMKSPLLFWRAEISPTFPPENVEHIVVELHASKGHYATSPSRLLVEAPLADLVPVVKQAPVEFMMPLWVLLGAGQDLNITIEEDEYVWVRIRIGRQAALHARGSMGVTVLTYQEMYVMDGLCTRDVQ